MKFCYIADLGKKLPNVITLRDILGENWLQAPHKNSYLEETSMKSYDITRRGFILSGMGAGFATL